MWSPGGDSLHGVSARDTDWEGVRLHVVTGKGGTGKTTVAGALAIALASGGRRVLLMEVEGRQGIARLFDSPPLPYAERRVAVAPGTPTLPGGEVYALAADPEAALHRVPGDVLQPPARRDRADPPGRGRLRHHDRPRPA